MKIATWNVNGIRARQAQVQDWIEAERPDVVCLQEIKASPDQLPVWLCDLEGYWCYWHGEKGYSGVGLHVSKAVSPERPDFTHPVFDYENRMVQVRLPALTVISVDAASSVCNRISAGCAGRLAQHGVERRSHPPGTHPR